MKPETTAMKRKLVKQESTMKRFTATRTGQDTFDFSLETKWGMSRLGPVRMLVHEVRAFKL